MSTQSDAADRILVDMADKDAAWGPLLFLRPRPVDCFTMVRTLTIAALIGGVQGMAVNLGMGLAGNLTSQAVIVPVYMMPLVVTAIVAVALRVSIVAAWNRRAERLARLESWAGNSGC
jgi:hypothetical protein